MLETKELNLRVDLQDGFAGVIPIRKRICDEHRDDDNFLYYRDLVLTKKIGASFFEGGPCLVLVVMAFSYLHHKVHVKVTTI